MKTISLYVVCVAICLVLSGCGGGEETTPAASTGLPTAGTVSTGSVTATSMTVNWSAGSDTETGTAALEYKVVYSTSNNITTVADAETNGTLALNWSVATLTTNLTGLTHSSTYYIAVLVRDGASNKAIATTSATTLCSGKIIFLATVSNGNLGGPSGADAICDAQKPSGSGTFKAMLSDGTNRVACTVGGGDCRTSVVGAVDWPVHSGVTYCKSDYSAKVGTGSTYDRITVPTAGVLASSATHVFTGVNIYFGDASGSNCSGFTSTAGSAVIGNAAGTANNASSNEFMVRNTSAPYFLSCNTAASIYCVEQ